MRIKSMLSAKNAAMDMLLFEFAVTGGSVNKCPCQTYKTDQAKNFWLDLSWCVLTVQLCAVAFLP